MPREQAAALSGYSARFHSPAKASLWLGLLSYTKSDETNLSLFSPEWFVKDTRPGICQKIGGFVYHLSSLWTGEEGGWCFLFGASKEDIAI